MKATSIANIGFFVLISFCFGRTVAFAIKTHLESNANQNSKNDTLVFAHVVSEIMNNLVYNGSFCEYF